MQYYPHEKFKRQERRRRAPGRPALVRARGQGKPLVRAHGMREEGLHGLHGRHGASGVDVREPRARAGPRHLRLDGKEIGRARLPPSQKQGGWTVRSIRRSGSGAPLPTIGVPTPRCSVTHYRMPVAEIDGRGRF